MRFYLGDDNLTEWYGDDWDDTPYECNAGEVYGEYVKGYRDVVFRLKTWYWNLLVVLVIVAGVRTICEVEEFLVLFMCQKKYMTIAGMIALIVG